MAFIHHHSVRQRLQAHYLTGYGFIMTILGPITTISVSIALNILVISTDQHFVIIYWPNS